MAKDRICLQSQMDAQCVLVQKSSRSLSIFPRCPACAVDYQNRSPTYFALTRIARSIDFANRCGPWPLMDPTFGAGKFLTGKPFRRQCGQPSNWAEAGLRAVCVPKTLFELMTVMESPKLRNDRACSVSFLAVLASPFKSKLRLEAENAVASTSVDCLDIVRLHGRVRLHEHDRWFFIQLYRCFHQS